jgi:hypothetical protein
LERINCKPVHALHQLIMNGSRSSPPQSLASSPALLLSHLRAHCSEKIEIIRLKRAIGFDCLRVLTCLEIANQELTSESQMWQGIDLPAYQHYWAGKRELFYDNFDLQNIQMQCALMMTTKQAVLDGRITSQAGIARVGEITEGILEIDKGNGKLKLRFRGFLLRFIR